MQSVAKILMAAAMVAFAGIANAETNSEIALLFGRSEAVSDPKLSPDGHYVGMRCAPQVQPALCIFDVAGGGEPVVVPALADTRITDFYWANEDTLVMNADIFQKVSVSSGVKDFVFARAFAFNVTTKKPVFLLKQYAAGYTSGNTLATVMPDEPGSILISMQKERAPGKAYDSKIQKDRETDLVYDAVKVDLKNGNGRSVANGGLKSYGGVHSPSGDLVAVLFYDRQPNNKHTLKITSGRKTIFERRDLDYNPIRVWGLDTSGKNIVVFLEEEGGLHKLALSDGALSSVTLPPRGGPGIISPILDDRTQVVVGYEWQSDKTLQIFEDPALREQYEGLSGAFPQAVVTLMSWTDDRAESIVRVETPGQPADYYIFTAARGELSPIGNAAPHLADRQLAPVIPVRYSAADGLEINGYLTLPPGKTRADGPFPMIVLPHGGPEARDYQAFDWWPQAYAAAGYAVLQPNFRGSSGYGLEFRDAGYGEFGGKMVTDVLDGVRWAVTEGIAKEGAVCAAGASYGGYSALMLGSVGGKEIRCVVSVNGLTNPLPMLADRERHSFVYNYLIRYMGINEFADIPGRTALTPVRRVDDIKAPVLLIAGKQDMVVPYTQSEAFMAAARHRQDVSLVSMEGEDHFVTSSYARHRVLEESLNFISRYLPPTE